ncbi:hypothetical protein GCM10010994_47140 [Chelatococcus reniformis]|uniref:Protein MgtC n=1 Tax=Chelatococcus reniformis TaxID=1494448 RepID=A0A916XLG9_9HYPH|nr:hypothetical protein GCM10010994_47140 [Chelatococcus reniformis]
MAVGVAAFVDLAMRIYGAEGAARVISYVVSGIGFLGAGVIMKEGLNILGLNTAANCGARPPRARAPARIWRRKRRW